ncbi:MAG: mechanosensitive ion channel [Myxococcales bacterium]|nr:mechanosensitive ion channel [Myxococcales bacterium]
MQTPAWLHETFLGVEVSNYLILLGLLFAAMVARHIGEVVLGRKLQALASRANSGHLQAALTRLDRAFGFVAFAVVLFLTLPLVDLPTSTANVLRVAARALVAGGGVWLAFRLLDVVFDHLAAKAERTESKLDDQLVPILRRTAKGFTLVVGGLFTLQNMEVDIGSLLAGLGLGGLAFALAAKDTIANFFGSLVIFVDKPFTIGDRIKLDEVEGVVEEVGLRTTRIRTFQQSLLTVPNARMTTAMIDNYGARRYRRYSTTLGITYDTPPELVQGFCEGIRAVIAGMPNMRTGFYLVEFSGFADCSLSIMVYCFIDTTSWSREMQTRTSLNLEILRLAARMGVRFAFPTTSIHVESLAAPGTIAPAVVAPPAPELASLVRGFGEGGVDARPDGIDIAGGVRADGTGVVAGMDEGEA